MNSRWSIAEPGSRAGSAPAEISEQLLQHGPATACLPHDGWVTAIGSGAGVVVDISKRPLDAAVMAGVPDIDTYVLHVVRDPRAVVHSWRRAKTFSAAGQVRTMGTRGLASSVRRWTSNALFAEALRRRLPADRWLHLRMCETCGKIGCCDSSPRRHARAHAGVIGHPIVRSLEPGENWRWCFVHEAFV